MPDILLQWNAQDPPSTFEINRNNAIASYQGNRNPFIDNPYLATRIWSGPAATDTWSTLNSQAVATSEFVLYPTQTDGLIYIKTNTESNYQIKTYNSYGRAVNTRNTNNSIDISNEPTGMYFIQISGENYNQTFKIIKE
jgi:hypothetical protein